MEIRIADPYTFYQKRTVKKMLNHSNKKSTQFYIHFTNVLSLGIITQTIIEKGEHVYTDYGTPTLKHQLENKIYKYGTVP